MDVAATADRIINTILLNPQTGSDMLRVLPILTVFLLFNGYSPIFSQSGILSPDEIEKKLNRASEKFNVGEEEESLRLFLAVLNTDEDNYEALWNTSLIYARMGFRYDDESKMEEYYEKAKEMAEKTKEYHPDKGKSYYVYSVAVGRMTELMGKRDRIRAAHELEENIKKAAELEPEYAPIWHLYGVWHSDVANVSRAERFVARLISGRLPDGSNEKAEEYLKKAVEMDGESFLFKLDLVRHYIEMDEEDKARPLLEEILDMQPRTKDDPSNQKKAEELLKEID